MLACMYDNIKIKLSIMIHMHAYIHCIFAVHCQNVFKFIQLVDGRAGKKTFFHPLRCSRIFFSFICAYIFVMQRRMEEIIVVREYFIFF